jgi:glycolate oxidase FAD binding subunit
MTAFHPVQAEEVAGIVREGRPLEVCGLGSKRALGHAVRAEAQLCLDRVDKLNFYEPDEMVVSVGAGMTVAALEQMLAQQRQRLAFAPPDWSALYGLDSAPQTIGGVIASNLSGSSRLSAGAARDHLIGFIAVNGRGEVFKSGGRVVKNVTGYDLCKLMAGSFGTLGVLTELTLRVLPIAEYEATLMLPNAAADAATRTFAQALGGPNEVVSAAWLPSALSARVGLVGNTGLLKLQGLEASVRDRIARLAQSFSVAVSIIEGDASAALWRALSNGTPLAADRTSAIWRISLPPTEGSTMLAAFPDASGWLDWAGGLLWLALPDDVASAQKLRARLTPSGGHATLVRASISTREQVPVFQPQPPGLSALNARVKEAFDPAKLLNPGRMG